MTTQTYDAITTTRLDPVDPGPEAAAPAAPVSSHLSSHATTLVVLRMLAVLALLVSAYAHMAMALDTGLQGRLFTMPQLFVGQSLACLGAAVLLLLRDRDRFWAPALLVAIGSSLPILASVYFPLPAIGPMPPINEPVWYGEKILSFLVSTSVPVLWLIRRISPPTGG